MKILGVRIVTTIMATLTAALSIILINVYETQAIIIFSIEVILLPAIYIIGNYCAENSIKKEYEDLMKSLTKQTEKLKDDFDKVRMENIEFKTMLDINFGFEDEEEN